MTQRDVIRDAFYGAHGLKKGITATRDAQAYGATVILVYSCMDILASLFRPSGQAEVRRKDFVAQCDRFMRLAGEVQIEGEERPEREGAPVWSACRSSRNSDAGWTPVTSNWSRARVQAT